MNYRISTILPIIVMAMAIAMYVMVMQILNDPTCAVLNGNSAPIIGEGFIKLIALCWW